MTKTLTEQWKDGELEFGYYYIDFGIGGVPMLFNGLEFYCERTQKPNAIKTILAPVPSYDEYRELLDLNVYEKDRKKVMGLEDKVKRLQEQLKEANEMLKGAKHLTVKDSNGAIMFELVSPEINDYLNKWGVK